MNGQSLLIYVSKRATEYETSGYDGSAVAIVGHAQDVTKRARYNNHIK